MERKTFPLGRCVFLFGLENSLSDVLSKIVNQASIDL
jgi:hypothetical protein